MAAAQARYIATVFLIVVLALFLRIRTLNSESLDGDEMFSRRIAMAAPAESWDAIRQDLVHPPLYYYILKADIAVLGADANSMRAISLACGVASVFVAALLGFVVPSVRGPALVAATLIAVNPLHIFYSQQTRSYSLYCLEFSILLVWAVLMEHYGHRLCYWVVGCLVSTALIYTHYIGALFAGALLFAILTSSIRRDVKIKSLYVGIIAVIAFLPWLVSEISVYRARGGFAAGTNWQGQPTLYDLRAIWASYLGIPELPCATTAALVLGGTLAAVACWKGWRESRNRPFVWMLTFSAIAPPLLLFVTSFRPFNQTLFGFRHLLPGIVPAVFLAALGLWEVAQMIPMRKCALIPGTAVLTAFPAVALVQQWHSPGREPYRDIAVELASMSPESRQAVYTTWMYGIGAPVNYYLKSDFVRPLPSNLSDLPTSFVVLYRPSIMDEAEKYKALLKRWPAAAATCSYLARPTSPFGTRLCAIARSTNELITISTWKKGG